MGPWEEEDGRQDSEEIRKGRRGEGVGRLLGGTDKGGYLLQNVSFFCCLGAST